MLAQPDNSRLVRLCILDGLVLTLNAGNTTRAKQRSSQIIQDDLPVNVKMYTHRFT